MNGGSINNYWVLLKPNLVGNAPLWWINQPYPMNIDAISIIHKHHFLTGRRNEGYHKSSTTTKK
jgi:hypothetical protein